MHEDCWQVGPERGFLISPDPLRHLSEAESSLPADMIAHLEDLAADLPELLGAEKLRAVLDGMPVYTAGDPALDEADPRVIERLLLLYAYFASAYVFAIPDDPATYLPPGVAVPFYILSERVARPPITAYATLVLGNWQRRDQSGWLELENLDTVQTFTGLADESWFVLVHVAIEAQAAAILQGIREAIQAAEADDPLAFQRALRAIHLGIVDITRTFHRMPQGCDPDVYYQTVRPYMFGFNGVVFEGVEVYGGEPQTLRGGSGAQSSIVPALVAALGIRHEQSGLTMHLEGMKLHMPAPHRRFITEMETSPIRPYVERNRYLADAYNHCLRQLITFRRAHFYYARTYIFEKSTNPVGTGGTTFMDFLSKLVEETEAHLL